MGPSMTRAAALVVVTLPVAPALAGGQTWTPPRTPDGRVLVLPWAEAKWDDDLRRLNDGRVHQTPLVRCIAPSARERER